MYRPVHSAQDITLLKVQPSRLPADTQTPGVQGPQGGSTAINIHSQHEYRLGGDGIEHHDNADITRDSRLLP